MAVRDRRLPKQGVAAAGVYVPCRKGAMAPFRIPERGGCAEGNQTPTLLRLFSERWKSPVAVFVEASRVVGTLYCFTASRRGGGWAWEPLAENECVEVGQRERR